MNAIIVIIIKVADETLPIGGFGLPYQMGRDSTKVGKKVGGGVCLYMNERWCDSANVCVKMRVCTEGVELISVSLRPRYLPREFRPIFVTIVYAPVFSPGLRCMCWKDNRCNLFQLMPHASLSAVLPTVIYEIG